MYEVSSFPLLNVSLNWSVLLSSLASLAFSQNAFAILVRVLASAFTLFV